MTAGFGGSGYTNPQTRALNSIANGGPADTSSQEAMVELLQKHSAQLKYLASNQKQMQQGINDATANPIQQLQQFVADVIVLLGGGELAKGALDFGDLQYILPALGALFGFGDGPFPISLFEAASKFFLGYVVPQEQFVDVINSIITAWAGVFGIDPEFIADVRDLIAAVGNLFGGIGNLFPSLNELFGALGITGADLGPLGQLIAPIIQLFAGIDLTKFGDFIEFITDAISPFIEQLTALINFINGMLAVLGYDGGDVVNSPIELLLRPFQNLIKFLADLNLFDPDFDLGAAAEAFVNLIIAPLNIFSIPDDVQADINAALGNMKDALNGTYTGSGPIFVAVQALAEAWLTATSPLNAANVFGRFGLGQFGGGVPLNALTAAVSNELEPFRATSELPATGDGDRDGWSFNASEDAAQVVCDGSPKALYLKSGVIKVESGQPLDTSVSVKYSGVTSGAGQTIRLVLETFTTDDGSGSATPVTVGAVTSPSGTITTPVSLGDSSWAIPAGVQSVRPVLQVDELVTAGTVFWLNTPSLKKKLAAPLAGGLPAAIQDRIDDLQATWDAFKGGVGGTVDDIEDALNGAGQAIRDAIANAMGHAGTGHTTANILTYLQSIPQTVVSGLSDLATQSNQIRDILAGLVVTPINSVIQDVKDWWTSVGQKVQNLTSGGTLPPTSVTGVGGASNIGQAIEDTWNKFWDGVFRTTGSTGKTTADVQTAAESIADGVDSAQTSATSAQSSANSLSEIIAIPHIVPSWQGGLADDVSFPIVQIDGTLTSSLNKLYLIPVTTQQDRAYTALKFGLTGTSMTNFYVGIYYMDPTTGDIAKILDCGDVKSSLTSSYNQQMITLPSALSATRGDTYFIGLLQVGGTAGSLHRWSNATNFSTGLYPQFVGEEASGTFSSLPSSVTAGNIIAGTRIWAALGDVTPILAPGSAFYADGFNRANAAQLTTPWTSRYVSGAGNVGVYSNVFGPQAGAAPGANVYTYNSKMSTTNHEVQVDVQDMPQSTSVGGAILLRGNASGCVYAHLRYTGSSGNWIAEIRSISSYSLGSNFGSGTVRASGPSGTYEGSALRCTAVGNTYAIYRAGTQIAQWVDSGGIFTYDGTSREVGVGGYANSGGYKIFDNWQAKDI